MLWLQINEEEDILCWSPMTSNRAKSKQEQSVLMFVPRAKGCLLSNYVSFSSSDNRAITLVEIHVGCMQGVEVSSNRFDTYGNARYAEFIELQNLRAIVSAHVKSEIS